MDVDDGIQSWSAFEERRQKSCSGSRLDRSNTTSAPDLGVDALYVSSSSPNIAPAAATLLRHSGLFAPSNREREEDGDQQQAEAQQRKSDEEFRLRFHWMRPHPSLAFSVEDQLLSEAETEEAANEQSTKKDRDSSGTRGKNKLSNKINPAIESSRLMEAYRYSQMYKNLPRAVESGNVDAADAPDENYDELGVKMNKQPSTTSEIPKIYCNLPLELPKLRINLASLIEPPLMTSWLPGEDISNYYDSEFEEE